MKQMMSQNSSSCNPQIDVTPTTFDIIIFINKEWANILKSSVSGHPASWLNDDDAKRCARAKAVLPDHFN
jgi:hypothetical protein